MIQCFDHLIILYWNVLGFFAQKLEIEVSPRDILLLAKTVSQLHDLLTSSISSASTPSTVEASVSGATEPLSADDFEREADLSQELQKDISRAVTALSTAKDVDNSFPRRESVGIVLTGATGFIGESILCTVVRYSLFPL